MNLFTFTGKIVKIPRLYRYNKKALTTIVLSTVNNKKGLFSYTVYCRAKNKLARTIFDLYRKGDFVIIEGSITIKQKSIINHQSKNKIKNFIVLKIHQIHPVSIVFK